MEGEGSFVQIELEEVEVDTSRVSELHVSSNPTCSFSNQEFNNRDCAERSKTTAKLCSLIVFYALVMLVEIFGGFKANSLAILTDAAHLLTDIAGFSVSLFTVWVSSWKATPQQSFGFNRLEVLGALLSIQMIWVISGTLIYEAINRLIHRSNKVNGELMFGIAAFGFLVNFLMVLWLGHDHSHHCHFQHSCTNEDHGHETEKLCPGNAEENGHLVSSTEQKTEILNINIQGAYLHLVTDLIQSVGVMIAGLVIWLKPNWLLVDLLCTLVFSIVALATTLPMLKSVFCILMERAPSELDIVSLENGIKCLRGVNNVHDLHVWSITAGKNVLACHVGVEPRVDPYQVTQRIKEYCEHKFRIHHVTIQIEEKLR